MGGKNNIVRASFPEGLHLQSSLGIILENISDGIAVLQEGKIKYCSPHLVRLSGYDQKTLAQRSFAEFLHPGDRKSLKTAIKGSLRKPETMGDIIFRVVHSEGSIRWVRVRFLPILLRGKQAILAIVSGITEQKKAEDALQRQLRELQVLQHVSAVCVESGRPEELLRKATRIIGKAFFPSNFAIFLLDETQKNLSILSSYHLNKRVQRLSQKISQGIIGRVVKTGRPLRSGDVRAEKNYLKVDPQTRSELCVPLKIGNKVLGAINTESPVLESFSADDQMLLTTFADLLAMGLERQKSEEALRASESKFRLLFDQSHDAVFLCAPDSSILDCNRQACILFRCTKEEILNKTYKQVVAEEFHDDSRRKLAKIRKGVRIAPYEKVIITKDGMRIAVELTPTPVYDEKGRLLWFQTVARDIRDRKEADAQQSALYRISKVSNEARDLDQLYRSLHQIIGELMNADNLYIALYNPVTDLLRFPYFVDRFDPPPDPFKPTRGLSAHVLHSGQPLLATRQQLLEMQRQGKLSIRGKLPLYWLGVPLKDFDGSVIGVLAVQSYNRKIRYSEKEKNILMFVSQQIAAAIERKTNEEKLRESEVRFTQFEKMETIGTLVSSITHDFNNILTSIMGNAELLDFRIQENHPDLRRHLHSIIQASESGTGLLKQLLAFTKKEEPQLEPLDLNHVISGWKEILERVAGDRIPIDIRLNPGLHPIHANAERVQQILMNLVINARDAMEDSGSIQISTENIDFRQQRFYKNMPLQGQHYVMLMVKDTGSGMDLATVSRIFDPFFTTKRKGTGLGLTIVKRIVENMGGFITIRSSRGRGSAFKIYVPRLEEQRSPAVQAIQDTIVYGNGERILVVEDDPEVREMLVILLRDYMNYTPLEAANGREALQVLKDNSVSMVITDMRMAEMDGLALLSKIREFHPQLHDKVIAITACSEYSEPFLKELGFRELIFKPIKAGFLSRTIKKYL